MGIENIRCSHLGLNNTGVFFPLSSCEILWIPTTGSTSRLQCCCWDVALSRFKHVVFSRQLVEVMVEHAGCFFTVYPSMYLAKEQSAIYQTVWSGNLRFFARS